MEQCINGSDKGILMENKMSALSVATLASLITSIASILGAAFYIDSRYAHADEVKTMSQRQDQWSQHIIYQQNKAIDNLRKQNIEDKLFELEQKSKPSNVDKALIQRYERELDEINTRLSK